MSTTNINDPASVVALLEQLKASSAWKELEQSTSLDNHAVPPSLNHDVEAVNLVSEAEAQDEGTVVETTDASTSGVGGTSVASLLSQLKPLSVHARSGTGSTWAGTTAGLVAPKPTVDIKEDRRNISFRDALPLLSDLASDDVFVTTVKKIKDDQDALERELYEDRESIYTKYHDKYKVAKNKAQMIGTVVSQHEVDMMTDGFKKDLQKFDYERVLPAWEGLVSRQQQELEGLHVPSMFLTAVPEDRKRQQQVMQVLETVVGATKSA